MKSHSLMTSKHYEEYVRLKRRLEYLELMATFGYRSSPSFRAEVDEAYRDVIGLVLTEVSAEP